MAKTPELPVIERTYELLIWAHQHIVRFPRHSRYSAGARLESKLSQLLDHLLDAKFSQSKDPALKQAALITEQLRFHFRMCLDTRLLSKRSHHFAVRSVVEISRQIQGWRRHHLQRAGQ